jgi:sialic acid synthase SpsE
MHNSDIRIIAETAFSHEGNPDYLFKQIDAAIKGQADIVKFQILSNLDSYYTSNHPAREVAVRWIISSATWEKAIKYAKSKGLFVLVLPLDLEAVSFIEINKLPVDYYEIHSVNFLEFPLLDTISNTDKKIILGIGGRTNEELKYTLSHFSNKKLELMYGFQSFPTEYKYLNLNKIKRFKEDFGVDVGYADHTHFSSNHFHRLNDIAFILGSRLFEKHIVVEKGEKRIDYESGIESEDFIKMRKRLNELKEIIGDGELSNLNEKELAYRGREKAVLYADDYKMGTVIGKNSILFRQYNGEKCSNQLKIVNYIGKTLNRNVKKMTPLLESDFEE